MIDLRSDTVTKPTAEMLKAMMSAEVGDDVFAEDTTVQQLENKVAKLFSQEAGLYCPSGTMANQIAIKVHTQPGDELICDTTAHIYNYEGGGISFNSGVQAKILNGNNGILDAQKVEEAINPNYDWLTCTKLVCVENTVNRAGGNYYTLDELKQIAEVCKKNKLNYHLDGARIFNALLESKNTTTEVGQLFNSISICLSKGLGAPIGSVLVGNNAFIDKARRIRKVFGGGMRQAGFIAAAGIYALDHHIARLKEDHHRAKILGNKLSELPVIETVLPVKTNIVIATLSASHPSEQFITQLNNAGIKIAGFGKQTIRMVTHLDFDDKMLDATLKVLSSY